MPRFAPVDAPTEPLIGFRRWDWNQVLEEGGARYTLYGGFGGLWDKASMQARCIGERNHAAPGKKCHCGIWCYWTPLGVPLRRSVPTVDGVVQAWGKVIPAQYGFRAEHVKVLALGFNEGTPMGVKGWCERNGVALVEEAKLEAVGEQWGAVERRVFEPLVPLGPPEPVKLKLDIDPSPYVTGRLLTGTTEGARITRPMFRDAAEAKAYVDHRVKHITSAAVDDWVAGRAAQQRIEIVKPGDMWNITQVIGDLFRKEQ